MHIEPDIKLDFDDVLIRPKRSTLVSRKDVELMRTFRFKWSPCFWSGIPIISSNMVSVTTPKVANIMEFNHMLACLPKQNQTIVGFYSNKIFTFGLNDLLDSGLNNVVPVPMWICLDFPNGYIEKVLDRVKQLRDIYKTSIIIAGNVVTPEMTEALILAGADIVKVGIGSGGACSTRVLTSIGYPQLSAVIECADAAHGLQGHIISDGGCRTVGDIVCAFGGGADFVMLGSMLAGCIENGQEFYGSSSERANNEHAGGLKDYRAAEGLEFKLPERGPLEKVLQEITGGLRSACAYIGARTIKETPKRTTFIRVNRKYNDFLWRYRT
jgi:GMP reductase